ncbi:hypothetical protein [Roseateles depolymerans]|uniref:Uncharacterized protein n=1 Tax=Roseateles depolymerans TaxID=76731 RepID=A0A0U3D323_9BURK|nr:hypothetical protein [Roseateles depolymerans]ALV08006.1 hypothetical protein RD2015_3550 [Roseateles depolymerans]REG21774.1 hypothetical protein DES44_0901 [Roseateles depolymerans]
MTAIPGSVADDPLRDDLPEPSFEDYFREGQLPQESLLWWQLERNEALLAAHRALFHGPSTLVRLRVWVFIELMTLPHSRLTRDDLNRHFHVLRDEALDLVLKRLRDAQLLAWDGSNQHYGVTPLAQQLMALVSPLTQAQDQDGDLVGLLANVAGAQQLGTLEPAQLHHLLAQLSRLYNEFADAIASGSEFHLRRARMRFERALKLVEKASEALSAIISQAQSEGNARLERLARELGLAQARLLAMASQFNRALQQADRQRVTLGSTGITTTDVRRWLQEVPFLENLALGALSRPVHPVFVAQHELLDTCEAEFERDRPKPPAVEPLPDGLQAPEGKLAVMSLPPDMGELQTLLGTWNQAGISMNDLRPAVLGGSYARAAYRAQLLPLLGDPQAQHLAGATGDMARQPWRVRWSAQQGPVQDEYVRWMSEGVLHGADVEPPREPEGSPLAPPPPAEPPKRGRRKKVAEAAPAAGASATEAPTTEAPVADVATADATTADATTAGASTADATTVAVTTETPPPNTAAASPAVPDALAGTAAAQAPLSSPGPTLRADPVGDDDTPVPEASSQP